MSTLTTEVPNLDFNNPSEKFGWAEYLVFIAMLAVSAGIGIYYGCCGKKQTTSEFLMGGRSMSVFPMTMSLVASFMSAITLLGTPVEMYQYGTMYLLIGIAYIFVMLSAAYLYLPIFFKLQVTSAYEYLEKRFGVSVRLLGSATFTLQMSIYQAIVVYAPALALSQVTGMDTYVAVAAIFAVCIFYTTIGGMKAVMWTDTFQVIVMFASMLIVIIKGAIDVGGHSVIWERALNGSRIEFDNFSFDPRVRHTFWSLIIGGYFTWIPIYGVNQSQVQRYLSVPSIKQAQIAILWNFFGLSSLLAVCCYGGLVIYAKYYDCDPLSAKRIENNDQLFPIYVMETLGELPGLPGLFVAGIFSGALSTVSSGLNSLAAIALEDFVKRLWFKNLTDDQATKVSKSLALGFGLVSFGLVFIAAQLGGVLQAALSIFGMIGGPLLGVFTLGMFFPWANSKGAFVGLSCSLLFMFWLGFGTNVEIQRGNLVIPKLDFSIDGCPANLNATLSPRKEGMHGGLMEFYRVSYMWYSMIGAWFVIIFGLIISFLTNPQNPRDLDPDLISPPINKLVKYLFPKFRMKVGWDLGANIKKKESKVRTSTKQRRNVTNGNGYHNTSFQTDIETKF